MGSRIRKDPEKIYEMFCEIAKPADKTQDPFLLQVFPEDYNDVDVLKSISKFSFPCDTDCSVVDHFTFVLTDIESKYRFGYCRHGTTAQTCLCIVSYLPWFEIFYRFLNHVAEIVNRSDHNLSIPLLEALYLQAVPMPTLELKFETPDHRDCFSFISPDTKCLPKIPENRSLTEYFNAVDVNNMMIIFASMLCERRILVTSQKLSRLTACVHASASLLYPMNWQHLFIPVLPAHLMDYVTAPMPYLIGIHSSLMGKIRPNELGDAVILDADKNRVTTPHNDLEEMPSEVTSILRKSLRQGSGHTALLGDAVSRAFLRALIYIIGGYRDALQFRPGEKICFSKELYVCTRSAAMKPYLEKMLQLQIFEQFITDRVDMLNSGAGFSDEFEVEAGLWSDQYNSSRRYREWMGNHRRKFKKEFTEVKQKVRTKSRQAYKDIVAKIEDIKKDEDFSSGMHVQPSAKPGPPQRPPPPLFHQPKVQPPPSSSSLEPVARQYCLLDLDNGAEPHRSRRMSSDDLDTDSGLARISINLMDDPDIQQAFRKSYSLEDLSSSNVVELDSSIEEAEEALDSCQFILDSSAESSQIIPESRTTNTLFSAEEPRRTPSPKPPIPLRSPISTNPLVRRPMNKPASQPLLRKAPISPRRTPNSVSLLFSAPSKHRMATTLNLSPNPVQIQSEPLIQLSPDDILDEHSFVSMASQPSAGTASSAFDLNDSFSSCDSSAQPLNHDSFGFKKAGMIEARRQFMQAESVAPSLKPSGTSELAEFDPLKQGRLIIEDPLSSVSNVSSLSSDQDDLLREWDLDFNKMSLTSKPLTTSHSDHCNRSVSHSGAAPVERSASMRGAHGVYSPLPFGSVISPPSQTVLQSRIKTGISVQRPLSAHITSSNLSNNFKPTPSLPSLALPNSNTVKWEKFDS